ncbi:Triosephosphate isomerase, cytosolic [Tritrichomonas foetus]|uniref:Triosephosphate isomerase n=1 Tax=Tritrichomonas foetus TaxID=1144522 RepID=A0A1J4K874_9EUKA|nr:triosephosphate isomerase, cytosolic [Tritrichomonas foetus]OHT05862.1 Triosephosphate isomerase, cytosolic [Tritrichomonas foetus]|eukprot:OHT05862.1 Triosephosphate isomerase, cytosolic [Tritrichomonas foetus]
MGRRFLVGGNWKANPKTIEEAKKLIELLNGAQINAEVDVVVGAPFIFLPLLKDTLRKDWHPSAENIFTKDNGAFTGEVTAPMLKSFGIEWTILGHSERRDILKEDDDFLAQKVTQALNHGLKIIFCCGEHLEERQAGTQNAFVSAQIEKMIPAVPEGKWGDVVIAYEPIWAIGTGKVASTKDAQDMGKVIRDILAAKVSPEVANATRILYGGSVKADNCNELAEQPDVDGFLVGGASLTAGFIDIVNSASHSK